MNIGIVLPHLGSAQNTFYAIKAANKLIDNKYKDDVVLFFEHLITPIIQPKCATMCINELMSFHGTIITSSLNNTTTTLATHGRKSNKICFYMWDLEWMRPGNNIYLYNYNAMNRVNKLIARSHSHAKAIENYCNRKVDLVLEEFDIEEIIK